MVCTWVLGLDGTNQQLMSHLFGLLNSIPRVTSASLRNSVKERTCIDQNQKKSDPEHVIILLNFNHYNEQFFGESFMEGFQVVAPLIW